jgi:hypothetical protein
VQRRRLAPATVPPASASSRPGHTNGWLGKL